MVSDRLPWVFTMLIYFEKISRFRYRAYQRWRCRELCSTLSQIIRLKASDDASLFNQSWSLTTIMEKSLGTRQCGPHNAAETRLRFICNSRRHDRWRHCDCEADIWYIWLAACDCQADIWYIWLAVAVTSSIVASSCIKVSRQRDFHWLHRPKCSFILFEKCLLFGESRPILVMQIIGTLRFNDADDNENVKKNNRFN